MSHLPHHSSSFNPGSASAKSRASMQQICSSLSCLRSLLVLIFSGFFLNAQILVFGDGDLGRYLKLDYVLRLGPSRQEYGLRKRERDRDFAFTQFTPIQKGHRKTYSEGSHLQARKRALTRNLISWHLDLGLLDYRIAQNKFLLFKTSGLCYFVVKCKQTNTSMY